ncbi:hypothetical protein EMIT036CA2_30642 [Chryseobacterium sp. IT-36CA2]
MEKTFVQIQLKLFCENFPTHTIHPASWNFVSFAGNITECLYST